MEVVDSEQRKTEKRWKTFFSKCHSVKTFFFSLLGFAALGLFQLLENVFQNVKHNLDIQQKF
jgi:hypothetical protein